MKNPSKSFKQTRGSALLTVMMVILIMSVLTASILTYSMTEKRSNQFQRLVLTTRNMAENCVTYAAAQLSAKLWRLRSTSPVQYSGSNALNLPPADSILVTENGAANPGVVDLHAGLISSTNLTYIDPTNAANADNPNKGLSVITSYVNIVASAKVTSPLVPSYTSYLEQDLSVAQIPLYQFAIFYNMDLEFGPGADMIISGPVHANGRLIARDQYGRTNTLQFKDRVSATGGFYANVTKLGAIYGNSGTADNNTGGTGPLYFQSTSGTVTDIRTSANLFRDHTWSTDAAGTETAVTSSKFGTWATSTFTGNLRTSAHGVTSISLPGVNETASSSRKNAARALIEAPKTDDNASIVQYKFSRNTGLYIIVNPTGTNPSRADGKRVGILPDATTVLMEPYTYRCWLNSIDSDGVTHHLTEVVLPGQPSYYDTGTGAMTRNNLPNRFTNKTAIGSNQVLRIPSPNSKTYPTNTAAYPDATATTPLDAPYRTFDFGGAQQANFYEDPTVPINTTGYRTGTPSLTSFTDGYFYDLRRSNGSNGYGAPATSRATTNFLPRPIAKIDFDMTRFRLAVERTMYNATASSTIYNPDVPTNANWANNVLNKNAAPKSYSLYPNLGSIAVPNYPTTFPTNATGVITCDPFRIYMATPVGVTPVPLGNTDLLNTAATATPWYDGIAIYIYSADAEDLTMLNTTTRNRMDSGVRLWNGRGSVVSLNSQDRTGFSLATNDAAYIVGHFNADGTINSTTTSTSNPGGYSARYPESTTEKLCNVMADALTVLSQPVYKSSGGFYIQDTGWSDSLSANSYRSSSWSNSWMTTNPSTSNQYDGITSNVYTGRMPNEGSYTTTPSYTTDSTGYSPTITYNNTIYTNNIKNIKFEGSTTEISTCLMQGIVRTTSAAYPRSREYVDGLPTGALLTYETLGYQNSGGVHNFPRMLEDWTTGDADLYIRGSMVAMCYSEVAREPWLGTRIYSAPGRCWGLHNNLRAENSGNGGHDVPLEPMLINVSRWHFAELTAAKYADKVAEINALPTN